MYIVLLSGVYLVWMKGKATSRANLLSHKAVMVTDRIDQLITVSAVDLD